MLIDIKITTKRNYQYRIFIVEHLSSKRLASNISLECDSLKLVWHDKKTIAVDAPQERLFRLDRLCEVLGGKSIEK